MIISRDQPSKTAMTIQDKITRAEVKLAELEGRLGLARERRQIRNGYHKSVQSTSEMKLRQKVSAQYAVLSALRAESVARGIGPICAGKF